MTADETETPAYRLMYLNQVYLLTTAHECDGDKCAPHIIPQLWATAVSFNPPMVAISVAKDRFAHHAIQETREFVLNIPSHEMAQKVWGCAPSGRGREKFERVGLTPIKASKVSAPLIKECMGAIECKVAHQIDAGDHSVFVAHVLTTHSNGEGKFLLNADGQHNFTFTRQGYSLKTGAQKK